MSQPSCVLSIQSLYSSPFAAPHIRGNVQPLGICGLGGSLGAAVRAGPGDRLASGDRDGVCLLPGASLLAAIPRDEK